MFLFFVVVLITSSMDVSAEIHSFGADLSPEETQYQKAKDYYYQLRRDHTIQDNRLNWLLGTREFRRIYLENPKGDLAPNCLFMMATMQYRMYLRFHIPEDLEEALTYYRDVWQLFPGNTLADDAMYWSAEIYSKYKNNIKKTIQLYSQQIKRYPDGDKYAQALNRLRELDAAKKTPASETIVPASADLSLNKVLPVQYWSSDDYTRIVIRSSGPVTYTSQLHETGSPKKLFIDFSHSTIDKKYTKPVSINEGLLQQIYSFQFEENTVRIALDIESISTYKIFSLNDPFRVIVDVRGQQQIMSVSKPVPQLTREQVEPPHKRIPAITDAKQLPKKTTAKPPPPVQSDDPFIVLNEKNKRKPGSDRPARDIEQSTTLSLAQQLGLGVRRIIIDPGHGGKDPGAMGNGLKEKDITLKVARLTAEKLREHNYEVILTRNSDRYLALEERTAIANTSKADLFVSIHVNAHPKRETRGVETFYLNLATNTEAMRVAALENATSTLNISDMQDILTDLMQNSKIQESSVLAEYVQNKLVAGLQESRFTTIDLGVKQAPFYVLIGAEMPAILAEISFVSNPIDAKMLRQEHFLDEVAEQITAGVSGYVDHQATAALQL